MALMELKNIFKAATMLQYTFKAAAYTAAIGPAVYGVGAALGGDHIHDCDDADPANIYNPGEVYCEGSGFDWSSYGEQAAGLAWDIYKWEGKLIYDTAAFTWGGVDSALYWLNNTFNEQASTSPGTEPNTANTNIVAVAPGSDGHNYVAHVPNDVTAKNDSKPSMG